MLHIFIYFLYLFNSLANYKIKVTKIMDIVYHNEKYCLYLFNSCYFFCNENLVKNKYRDKGGRKSRMDSKN